MRNMILIADASESSRNKLKEVLGENFVVLTAADEKDAITLISENSKKLCAVIVDSILSGGAVSVLKFMSATSLVGKFPVLFISSFNLEDDDMKEFSEEIDDIIEKPFNTDIIKRRIRNLVELYNFRRSKNNQTDIN